MTIQTAIWIPPSLCGCQLQITADWPNKLPVAQFIMADGTTKNISLTFRHPNQFSIQDIQIIHACPSHAGVNMPNVERHFETRPNGETYQARGYLRHHENVTHHPLPTKNFQIGDSKVSVTSDPSEMYGYNIMDVIDVPTQAHIIYEHLCQYKGNTKHFTCGCAAHIFTDDKDTKTYLNHPLVTQKCINHQNDTIDMQQAQADYNAAQGAVASAPIS